jgi:hypothetical protein
MLISATVESYGCVVGVIADWRKGIETLFDTNDLAFSPENRTSRFDERLGIHEFLPLAHVTQQSTKSRGMIPASGAGGPEFDAVPYSCSATKPESIIF